jgi:septal ring factor EnvC (AmiA/AmiB activator)
MNAGKNIFFGVLLLFIFPSFFVQAQRNKAQLQKEKQRNLEKIKETERILGETATAKKNSLGELVGLNHRIQQQETLITSVKSEIGLLDRDISENNQLIDALETDLINLKKEYADMLFSAQKASGKVDDLMFLFSANSFYQMVMRMKYMEQYGNARTEQAEAIIKVQEALGLQVHQTEVIRKEKNSLLNEEITENKNLTDLKTKQRQLVSSLEKQEKQLKKDIDETKKAVAKLDKEISDIIKEEMERAAREARAATNNTKKTADIALSSSFEDNKAKFSWPASGFISQKFGRQNHPILKGIILQCDDIKIQTKQGEKVTAIFNGEIARIAPIPGFGNTVLISHGEYYSVYTGLTNLSVKKGDKVKTNQELGQVLLNSEGISELRFRIYKNKTVLDPEAWLKD